MRTREFKIDIEKGISILFLDSIRNSYPGPMLVTWNIFTVTNENYERHIDPILPLNNQRRRKTLLKES